MAEKEEVKIRDREMHLVKEALRIERANARRDTSKQKSRGEVRGGGAKPWRQKGTGRARQGSIRAIQWVGGGQAFGTTLENHHRKANRKVRRRAMETVLQWKKDSGRVMVDPLKFDEPSTKKFISMLEDKEISGKVLLLYNGEDTVKNAVKSARNLKNVKTLHADSINLQDLLNADWLLTLPEIAERLNLTSG